MPVLVVMLAAIVVLAVAYRLYGRLLGRWFDLDPSTPTPAVEMRDGLDYAAIPPRYLLGQHFSAIAAAGPIVGPILGATLFGWGPALLWILIGAVFVGGVHDFAALVASVRHRAASVSELVRRYVSRRAFIGFLIFIWIALVYIVVAFTDITARSFVGVITLEDGSAVSGGGIATSSLLYLALPVLMALAMRFLRLNLLVATAVFLPLVAGAIWAGQHLPLDLTALVGGGPRAEERAVRIWEVLLLVYCTAASIAPVWLLLQPRGHLGGCFLYASLACAALGLVFGNRHIHQPAFTGSWSAPDGSPLYPILFITIACGACSGFHALVSTGTTSKQLAREPDALPVAYGGMLLEALVAVVALACVMIVPADPAGAEMLKRGPNYIYAHGIGSFAAVCGIPLAVGIAFGLLAFTTFVYDTLDVSTRLGRYILQELTGWRGWPGRILATALTAGVPLIFVMQTSTDAKGRVVPAWKVFWNLFGASNQLLAALTLVGVTVWLAATRRRPGVLAVVGLPAVFMLVTSLWALGRLVITGFSRSGPFGLIPWVASALITLALWLVIECAIAVLRRAPVKDAGPPSDSVARAPC